jgi:hypothetical protein
MGRGGFPPLLYGEMTRRNDVKMPYPRHRVVLVVGAQAVAQQGRAA